MRAGGIVLCGGQSRRMGTSKAMLPFGDETMLGRVVRLLGEAVDPIVVVATRNQPLPPLPESVVVTYDRQVDQGPLEGLFCGLTALAERVDLVYATACDTPLLAPAFVKYMLDLCQAQDAAVPQEGQFYHPLAAVYRPTIVQVIRQLLAQQIRRPVAIFESVPTRTVEVELLRAVDPQLHSLMNVNCPEDYERVLQLAGFA